MNLKYMKFSLFEISYNKKWTFSRHSNLLRCTCTQLTKGVFFIILWRYTYFSKQQKEKNRAFLYLSVTLNSIYNELSKRDVKFIYVVIKALYV